MCINNNKLIIVSSKLASNNRLKKQSLKKDIALPNESPKTLERNPAINTHPSPSPNLLILKNKFSKLFICFFGTSRTDNQWF